MEISGNTIEGRKIAGDEPETPQLERITAVLMSCTDNFEDALRRLAARIDRLDGGRPPLTADGKTSRPERAGQLGILEDYAEGLLGRIGNLSIEIDRLERL